MSIHAPIGFTLRNCDALQCHLNRLARSGADEVLMPAAALRAALWAARGHWRRPSRWPALEQAAHEAARLRPPGLVAVPARTMQQITGAARARLEQGDRK